ncbi:MAG: alpha-ribazole phosphatase family protein [Candidatus Accumulibacter sp.]|uniref:alpha-ribazole phosphatase family protein n=1 Tax=Accumulibacter sp. TaxID=2053492 RepID=UPI001A52C580|nr:alpha-ribazole phosphatase family protein [Accumulibacter sp.]MBL8395031.1 alpha-ribazole phosphatase family protein [Accumulibacter sp.]
MQLFLIRHPRPLLAAGICYGQLDVEAEDPLPIARRLQALLPSGTPVIASPLQRARLLAEALDRQARFDQRLREIDFGAWEGLPWEAIGRPMLNAWAADVLHFVPPGGESVAMLQARVVECVASLRGERCALVTHAGAIRALLGHWLRLPIGEWSRLAVDFGSLTLLEIDRASEPWPGASGPSAASLHYLNHLGEVPADLINRADGAAHAGS